MKTIAARWLANFEGALERGDEAALRELFHADSHWRDVLALTWHIATVSGRDELASQLLARGRGAKAQRFMVDPARTAPRRVTRAGTEAIEAIFKFETAVGRGSGVLRLTGNRGEQAKAWTLLTALEELRGFEETIGKRRPGGQSFSREFGGPNWLDVRNSSRDYADRDPTVLVVGGGHAGLSIAARLGQLGVDTLIVDREQRIGDNWRKRYRALTLHNQVHVNHLPYMPFPPSWPVYIPKDKLASWFEAYVEAMELNFWTDSALESAAYDESAGCWTARIVGSSGAARELRPRHIVMATGVSGIPSRPDIPTLERFAGTLLHSSRYEEGGAWKGKRAIVVGTGNSAHDIAQDLYSSGAQVTLVQRGPTLVINIEPSAQLVYSLYDEGPPLEDCDLITASVPLALSRRTHQLATEHARKLDAALLEGLERRGFRLDFGEDGTGWQFKYLTRGGGYYFNVGCSELLAQGRIGLVQHSDILEFVPEGVRLRSGETLAADLVVLATGWKGLEHLVRRIFGSQVAARVGPVWGFGDSQELRNMFARTAQRGLWFMGGSFAQCRIYSKYLALQIKATEAGLLYSQRPAGMGRPAKSSAVSAPSG